MDFKASENKLSDVKQNGVLIAYFSHSGNTRLAAEEIEKLTNGNVFEIKPVKAYPDGYNDCVTQAKKECADHFKPELEGMLKDIGKYEVIYIGTPNWWHTMAPPVLSFLVSHDLKGKKVIPFITHGGGGMARCENDIQQACPGSIFGQAIALYGSGRSDNKTKLKEWIDINKTTNI